MSTATLAAASPSVPARRPRALPALAGLAYTASWVAGLSIFSVSTEVHATGAQVLAGYAGHQAVATAQFALTEGVPAICLAIVAVALASAGKRAGANGLARLVMSTGIAAAAVSLVQFLLGGYLAGPVTSAGNASTARTLFEIINRLDGVKMLLLAGLAAAGVALGTRTGLLPRWLGYTGMVLVVALIASAVGYLFLVGALSVAAYVSLPLLLVWVTAAGLSLARRGR